MPEPQRFVLFYNKQSFLVRVVLTRQTAESRVKPYPEIVVRAKAALEKAHKSGQISFYDIYEEELNRVWSALRNSRGIGHDYSISFPLAAGSPDIPGLVLESAGLQSPGLFISIGPNYNKNSTRREWLQTTIMRFAKDSGLTESLLPAQLQSAIVRILSGEVLTKFKVSAGPVPLRPANSDEVFLIKSSRLRNEVVVYVYDLVALSTAAAVDNLSEMIRQGLKKMKKGDSPSMRFFKQSVVERIKAALNGPERLGIGMPLSILAAIPMASYLTRGRPAAKRYLNFHISKDKMTATIIKFDMKHYLDPAFKMSKGFLVEQLSLDSIGAEVPVDYYRAIEAAHLRRATLDQKTVAVGVAPLPAKDPFLYLIYKEAPLESSSEENINMRDAQQKTIVPRGSLLAEVRYNTPAEMGVNIYGEKLESKNVTPFAVTLGEGIAEKVKGKFYSSWDGLPKFDGSVLSVSKAFILDGDVNLASGNIYFDGPVLINGSVDTGALVRVTGPLQIKGSIAGGIVISGEAIEVMESIVTGPQGKVVCAARITANFIENSRIECAESIVVQHSLLNSDVICGGSIIGATNASVIAGGTLVCGDSLIAANIGFTNGAITTLIAGVAYRDVRRLKILKTRLLSLTSGRDRYKNEFRELAQKKESRLTSIQKEMKVVLKKKNSQINPLIEKIELMLKNITDNSDYNSTSIIAASNVLSANCKIEISGHHVKIAADSIAVAIAAKQRRDTHILTYDELKTEIEKKNRLEATVKPPE